MRAIIVEDEQLSTTELRSGLSEVAPNIEVVAEARSVKEAVEKIGSVAHDLIFMDIHLGDGSSFDIFKKIKVDAPVIFITAYDKYALEAFKNRGIDYLLKPFGLGDLQRALDKLELINKRSLQDESPLTAISQPAKVYQERFMINIGSKIKSIESSEIAYFMADGKYLYLYTHQGAYYLIDQTITSISAKIDPSRFFRINRKFIVGFSAIKEMTKYSSNRIKITLDPPSPPDHDSIVSSERIQEFRLWLNR